MRSLACSAISAPWSQVRDLRSCSGRVVIVVAMASRTASAPCPASGGPFLTLGTVSRPCIGGRRSSIVNLVVRSTSVPIALLDRPMMSRVGPMDWLSRPTAARLADLSRSKAWPMICWAWVAGRLPVDLDLMVAKGHGDLYALWAAAHPEDVARVASCSTTLGWGAQLGASGQRHRAGGGLSERRSQEP